MLVYNILHLVSLCESVRLIVVLQGVGRFHAWFPCPKGFSFDILLPFLLRMAPGQECGAQIDLNAFKTQGGR